jgi:IS5 family transposase
MTQPGFFDLQNRLHKLSESNDPLALLSVKIRWAEFAPVLSRAVAKERKSNAGRKAFPPLLMFKVLIIQSLYSLSDEQAEFQINDRLSFQRFLGLGLESPSPDQKTIWHWRELLMNAGVLGDLFRKFDDMLSSEGFAAAKGTLIDATIVKAPRQRNTKAENETIKSGVVPVEWQSKPAKLAQKDTDARWVKKNGVSSFGYKAHVNADNKHKLIRSVEVTPASVHDGNVFTELLVKNRSKDLWADSAYLHRKDDLPVGYRERVCRKGRRGKPLSEFQKKCNRARSRIRCRVEHVFGQLKTHMRLFIRTIGIRRAEAKIVLASLCYNMRRYAYCARSA